MTTAPTCRSCGGAVTTDHRFCPACGELYPAAAGRGAADDALREVAAEVAALVREKARLGAELEQLASQSGERELTDEERGQWQQIYTRWRDVASEISLIVDRVYPRADSDRRSEAAGPPADGDRRSQQDRRDPFWTRTP